MHIFQDYLSVLAVLLLCPAMDSPFLAILSVMTFITLHII